MCRGTMPEKAAAEKLAAEKLAAEKAAAEKVTESGCRLSAVGS